jgi:hypothetical protein
VSLAGVIVGCGGRFHGGNVVCCPSNVKNCRGNILDI